ncbi:MAG: hypothetical protein ACYCSZ_01185 [Burkholderiales bacterium]
MSRSRRKQPIVAHTNCRSECQDKKIWHQRWRARERTALAILSPEDWSAYNKGGYLLILLAKEKYR